MSENDTTSRNGLGCWTADEYIEQRVKQYQQWYDTKAVTAKRRYLSMRSLTVIGGVIVPAIANASFTGKDFAVSAISLSVALLIALESVYHYREQWKNYRSTEQFLGKEMVLFLAGEGVYKGIQSARDAFIVFVERCENAIESENKSTLNIMTLAPQDQKQTQVSGNDQLNK